MRGRSTATALRTAGPKRTTFAPTGVSAKRKKKTSRGVSRSRSRSRSLSRGSRTSTTTAGRRKAGSTERPSWDDSTSDLSAYRLSKSELLRKKISLRSKHNVIYIPEEALREAKRKSDQRRQQQQQAAAAQKKKQKAQNPALENPNATGARDGKRNPKARNPNAQDSLNSSFEEEKLLQGAQSFNQVLLRHGVLGGAQGSDDGKSSSLNVVDLDDEITQFEHQQLLQMHRASSSNAKTKGKAHTGAKPRPKKLSPQKQKQKQLRGSTSTTVKDPVSAAFAPEAEMHAPHVMLPQGGGDRTNLQGHDSRESQRQCEQQQGRGSAVDEQSSSDGASSLDLILEDEEAGGPLEEVEAENHTAQVDAAPQRTHVEDSCSDNYDPQVEIEMLEEEVEAASSTHGSTGGGHKFQQTLALCKFLYAEMGTQRQQLKACQASNRVLQEQMSQLQESHRTLQREMEFLKLRHNLQGMQSQVSDSTNVITSVDTITSAKQCAVVSQQKPDVQNRQQQSERGVDAAGASAPSSKVRFADGHVEQKSHSSHGRVSSSTFVEPSRAEKEHRIPEVQATKQPHSLESTTDDASSHSGFTPHLSNSSSSAPVALNERTKEVLGSFDESSPASAVSDAQAEQEDDLAPLTIQGEEEVVDLSADAELDFDITRPLEDSLTPSQPIRSGTRTNLSTLSYSDSEEDNDGEDNEQDAFANNSNNNNTADADADAMDTPVQALPDNARFNGSSDSDDVSMSLTPADHQRSSEAHNESPADDTPVTGLAPGHWQQNHSAPPFAAANTMFLPLAGREHKSPGTPEATPPPKTSSKKTTSPGAGSISGSKIKGSFSVERSLKPSAADVPVPNKMCPEPSPRPLKSLPKQTQQPARNLRSKSVAAALAFKVDYSGASFEDESSVDDVESDGLIIRDSEYPRSSSRGEAPPSPLPQPRKPNDSHIRSNNSNNNNYSHADLDRSIQEDLEFLGNIVKAERKHSVKASPPLAELEARDFSSTFRPVVFGSL